MSASAADLPADAIQRVLFVASSVHVYQIPPLTSTKGYSAASWTADRKRQIFTARLRVIETALPLPDGSGEGESLSTEIRLEDPSTGDLFAAAPYAEPSAVEAALDSSRFFAVRVQDESGRKAMLGIGFEERGEAIDFGIALQEARKVQGGLLDGAGAGKGSKAPPPPVPEKVPVKRDLSLKEGEMIHIDLGTKVRRRKEVESGGEDGKGREALFSIAPPPYVEKGGGGGFPLLPPPPSSALHSKAKEKRRSRQDMAHAAPPAAELGFDDGEFGEFQ
ncbi:MAG: hypothetical protein Q9191_006350 [Dirinaria sp. TL-2023a]